MGSMPALKGCRQPAQYNARCSEAYHSHVFTGWPVCMAAMFLMPCAILQICDCSGPEARLLVEAHRFVCWRLAIWPRSCRPTLQLLA